LQYGVAGTLVLDGSQLLGRLCLPRLSIMQNSGPSSNGNSRGTAV